MELSEVIHFWWRVTARVFTNLRIKERFAGGLTIIGITIIVAWIFSQGITSVDWVKTGWISFSGSPPTEWQKLLVASVFAILINLIVQPAKMYKELGGFVNNPFELTARDPVKDNRSENQARSGSITVKNLHPKFRIEECFLTLDSIIDNAGNELLYSQQKKISWSSGLRDDPNDSKRINREIPVRPEVPVVADLVETDGEHQRIIPTVWSTHPPLPIGKYEFLVCAHGKFRDFEITKKEVFLVEYVEKNKVIITKKYGKQNT